MEILLICWIHDKNQRRLLLSQNIITVKAKSLFEHFKEIAVDGLSSLKFEAIYIDWRCYWRHVVAYVVIIMKFRSEGI